MTPNGGGDLGRLVHIQTGTHLAVVRCAVVVMVESIDVADALWSSIDASSQLIHVVDTLARIGLDRVPSVGVAVETGTGEVQVLVRGSARALADTADDTLVLGADGRHTWPSTWYVTLARVRLVLDQVRPDATTAARLQAGMQHRIGARWIAYYQVNRRAASSTSNRPKLSWIIIDLVASCRSRCVTCQSGSPATGSPSTIVS